MMNTTMKLLLLRRQPSYSNRVAALNPPLWFEGQDYNVGANTIANRGNGGSDLNGAGGNISVSGKAMDFNGTTSFIDVTANASINDLTTYTVVMICAPDGAGEASFGRFYDRGNEFWSFNGSFDGASSDMRSAEDTDATDANAVVTSAGLVAAQQVLLARTYDNAGERRVRLYKGVGDTVTQFTYGTHTAATGTLAAKNATLTIGNNPARSRTFDGLIYSFFIVSGVLSTEVLQQLTLAMPAYFQ